MRLGSHSSNRPSSPKFCPTCGAKLEPESMEPTADAREPHTNLIFWGLLGLGAIALLVTILTNYSTEDAIPQAHLSQTAPAVFIGDPEMYYERCGTPSKDDRQTLTNGDVQRTLVYSRDGVAIHFVLPPGQGWRAMSPYATAYPSSEAMGADAWRQRMHCLFDQNDATSDN